MIKKKYRDHRDMIVSILETLSNTTTEGVGMRRLMYKTDTSWNGLLDLLKYLLEKGLISKKVLPAMTLGPGLGTMVDIVGPRRNHSVFFITPKGNKFLHLYTRLVEEYLSGEKKLIVYPI